MRPRELVDLADTKIPIETVLMDLYQIEIPYGAGEWKAQCPLGHDHSDGGRSKAMKVFSDSNSAWCFSHGMKFTPVSLAQLKFDQPRVQAARALLDYYSISTRPPSPDERWETLEHQQQEEEQELDRESLKESFINFLSTLPLYSIRQFDSEVLRLVSKILRSADKLSSDSDYDTLEEWMSIAKKIMEDYWRRRDDWN